jgi:hypothetical protein
MAAPELVRSAFVKPSYELANDTLVILVDPCGSGFSCSRVATYQRAAFILEPYSSVF